MSVEKFVVATGADSLHIELVEQVASNVDTQQQQEIDQNYEFFLNADIMEQVFSFIDFQHRESIMACEQTCSLWRKILSNNERWQSTYNYLILNIPYSYRQFSIKIFPEFRAEFFKIIKLTATNRRDMHKVQQIQKKIWSVLTFSVIIIACLLILGLIYISIIIPITLDGVISGSTIWYTSIPAFLFFWAPAPHAIILWGIRFYLFYRYKLLNFDEWQQSDLSLIWLSTAPISLLSFAVGYASNAHSLSFIIFYAFTALYIIIPPIYAIVRRKKFFDCEVWWTPFNHKQAPAISTYFFGSLLLLLLCTQFALIAVKLDGYITTYWSVVFIPMWFCLVVALGAPLTLSPLLCYAFEMGKNRDDLDSNSMFYLVYLMSPLVCIPVTLVSLLITAWFTLFAVRLDGVVTFSYVYTFIPLYVLWCCLACAALCYRGIVLVNRNKNSM
jgi:hypothetical protein